MAKSLETQLAEELGIVPETPPPLTSEVRLLSEDAIPIPPTIGKRFAVMFDDAVRMMEARHTEWKRNINIFLNDEAKDAQTPIENLVRTTVEALVDFTYMRNPHGELSAVVEKDKKLAKILQRVLSALINKKAMPGISLLQKMWKQIIFAHLTNFGILELTWQSEKGSIEQILAVNDSVRERIKKERDQEKASVLYETLDILQQELDIRRHTGIGLRVRSPFALLVDPNCQELNLSDCKWIMDRDVMKIDQIKAEYTNYDKKQNKYFFKYRPNVELEFDGDYSDTSRESTEIAIIDAIMPDVEDEQAKLRAKNALPVVWVYDRTTRLKYLYIEGKWDVPLWVYEDEMGLSRFFPFFILAFSSPLNSIIQSGEVSHYIAIQDEINRINKQVSRTRRRAFNKYIYNSAAIDKEEATKIFNFAETSDNRVEAIGVRVRDQDKALSDVLEPLKLPSTQFKEIFDKTDLENALERTVRMNEVMRGAQFKTNTTNVAIDAYNEYASNRFEGLTDKIELNVEYLLWSICELVVSKMSQEQISQLIAIDDAEQFSPMTVADFNRQYNLVIAAGSTEKPTSSTKKKEAMRIIQMLGQFGTAAPMTVLTLVTRLLRSAFSKALVTDNDLKKLEQEGLAAMQKGVSTRETSEQKDR